MTPSNSHHDKPIDALNRVYNALSHPTRRRLLLALQEESPRTLGEIAAIQAELEHRESDAVVELHHVHLPLLADAGLIKWDPESETITKGPRFEVLRPHLNVLREQL